MDRKSDKRPKMRDWSREELTRLSDLWNLGRHPHEIGQLLGRTIDGVIQKARRMGLIRLRERDRALRPPAIDTEIISTRVNQNWTSDEEDRLRELALAGHSAEEIAEALDRKPGAIVRRAIKLGLTAKRKDRRRRDERAL